MSFFITPQNRLLYRLYCPNFFSTWYDKYFMLLCPYSITTDAIVAYLEVLLNQAFNTKTNFFNIKYQTHLFDYIYKDFIEVGEDVNNEAIIEAHEISTLLVDILDSLYWEIRPALHMLIGQPIEVENIHEDRDSFMITFTISRRHQYESRFSDINPDVNIYREYPSTPSGI